MPTLKKDAITNRSEILQSLIARLDSLFRGLDNDFSDKSLKIAVTDPQLMILIDNREFRDSISLSILNEFGSSFLDTSITATESPTADMIPFADGAYFSITTNKAKNRTHPSKSISEIVTKILKPFRPTDIITPAEIIPGKGSLSNKALLEELGTHFESQLKDLSVGNRMLYPMAFYIMLHPDDWAARKESLPFILPEVVDRFYGIIRRYLTRFPNFTPPSTHWLFQFAGCDIEEIQSEEGTMRFVTKGHITTLAKLTPTDTGGGAVTTQNMRLSVKRQDSGINKYININPDAIHTAVTIDKGRYTYRFDESKVLVPPSAKKSDIPTVTAIPSPSAAGIPLLRDNEGQKRVPTPQTIPAVPQPTAIAELSYTIGNVNYRYPVTNHNLIVGGSGDTRSGAGLLRIDTPEISPTHIHIKYSSEEHRFLICCFAPTRVNGRPLRVSTGNELQWYPLANRSSIFLNESFRILFTITQP